MGYEASATGSTSWFPLERSLTHWLPSNHMRCDIPQGQRIHGNPLNSLDQRRMLEDPKSTLCHLVLNYQLSTEDVIDYIGGLKS